MAAARHDPRDARDAKTVEARVRVEIPRDCDGDLQDGLEAKLARPSAVERVADTEIHALRPRLNDLSVDATVQFRVAVRGTALRTELEAVVGVREVAVADPR